jgi:hypothetical protein
MTPTLEILIPVKNPGARLVQTAESLAAQTDRTFTVRLSDNCSQSGTEHIEEAVRQLARAGITVHRTKTQREIKRLEHRNLIHSEARADWLKPVHTGDIFRPGFVEELQRRLAEQPLASLVRCDAELQTEWGMDTVRAPFKEARIPAARVGDYFPARVEWLCRASNVAYSRLAWLEAGGYSNHLTGFASLNLNLTLALHHGVENIAAPLVRVESADRLPLNESAGERVNLPVELWLILRQARNYCIASKVPWHCRWPWWRAITARMGHW